MRRFILIVAMISLGGCATTRLPEPDVVPEDEILEIGEERQRQMDDALVRYIEENRQIVYMPNDWQVMAYCTQSAVDDALEKGQVMCEPPKTPDPRATTSAPVFVLLKRKVNRPGRPGVWQIRYDNYTHSDLCIHTSWQLIDIEPNNDGYGWHYLSARTKMEHRILRQKTWIIGGQSIAIDFSGHVGALFIRRANDDGSCYATDNEVRSDK